MDQAQTRHGFLKNPFGFPAKIKRIQQGIARGKNRRPREFGERFGINDEGRRAQNQAAISQRQRDRNKNSRKKRRPLAPIAAGRRFGGNQLFQKIREPGMNLDFNRMRVFLFWKYAAQRGRATLAKFPRAPAFGRKTRNLDLKRGLEKRPQRASQQKEDQYTWNSFVRFNRG